MIYTQVTPSAFSTASQASPNPTVPVFSQDLQAQNGTLIVCSKTARMWMLGQGANLTNEWKPVLPYTRNDAGTAAVRVQNDNGIMRFAPESESIPAKVRLSTAVQFDDENITMPGIRHYPIFANLQKGAGTVRCRLGDFRLDAVFPERAVLGNDFTMTNANQVYTLTTLSYQASTEQYTAFEVRGVAYHSNGYELSVCVSRYRTGGSINEPIVATTVSSPSNGGYVPFSLRVDQAFLTGDGETGFDLLRVTAVSSHAGVVIKANPNYSFPDTRDPDVLPAATYRIAEVLA